MTVPPVRVVFDEALRAAILRELDGCLSRGSVAAGKKVQEFERFWAGYTGCACAVAVSSGGSALEILMRVLGVGGRDVLVPTNTFIATANAVIYAGGRPVFLDADPRTMAVTLEEIKKRRTPQTVGVIVVHIGGIITPEMPAIAEWCRGNRLWLVEDAAHAHGSELEGQRAGRFGVAAAYSFFATKVITSGEGGMIVCHDETMADACRRYRDYGKQSQWESVHTVISANYRMSDLTAVVGLEHARRLDGFIADRSSVAARYTEALDGVIEPILPAGWDRAAFRQALKDRGVSLSGGVYDIPLHAQPVFEGVIDSAEYPSANALCDRHVCLSMFSGMSEEQVAHVIGSVKDVVGDLTAACGKA